MKAWIFRADIYCDECGQELRAACDNALVADNGDSDTYPQGPYGNGGGEADCPQHCGKCGAFLQNPLTSDGEDYVREHNTGKAAQYWREYYSYLFE